MDGIGVVEEGAGGAAEVDGAGRPKAFKMKIQGGMLEALGINMYTSIGKCLVEFVANAYDSDATYVDVVIPFDRIAETRRAARDAARARAEAEGRDKFGVLLAPLPDDVVVSVSDDGHGMTADEVRTKFMPLNRKRRSDADGEETNVTSESGRRYVMGRKGLGKLAGFGAAEIVEVTTKRAGETYETTFVMEYERLRNSTDLPSIEIPATYVDGQDPARRGTTVRLRRLKCDAVRHSDDTIRETLASAFFGVRPDDFSVKVNGQQIVERTSRYEYEYAPDAGENGFARHAFEVEDVGTVSFDYVVKFRARTPDPDHPELDYGSLPAAKRGARIYCNNRLAAGPSLFALKTGMHNFYATDYLECVIRADELDRRTVDLVNTNRTQLREDNEVVQKLVEAVTAVMTKGISAHSAWRERKIDDRIGGKIAATPGLKWIEAMPKTQRDAARKLLKAVAVTHDLESPEFEEIAPHLMNAVNASDVLVRLIELRHDPRSIERVAASLTELGMLERKNVLTHYRGRRSAIEGLRTLVEHGEAASRGEPRTEKALHDLLKKRPWLVRPEYSGFVASDARMTTTLTNIARHLGIDDFAPPHVPENGADATRPDLVFVLGNSPDPYHLTVVELKTPTLPMTGEHLDQLKRYMRQIREWILTELRREVAVHGMLVGRMPAANATAVRERDLLNEIKERGPTTPW